MEKVLLDFSTFPLLCVTALSLDALQLLFFLVLESVMVKIFGFGIRKFKPLNDGPVIVTVYDSPTFRLMEPVPPSKFPSS